MAAAEGAVIACHTKEEFDAQMAKGKEAGRLVITDFMTTWCPGCKMMAPVFAECSMKYPAAVFLEVNVEEVEEVGDKYKIQRVPTFYFFRNGETLESFVGAYPEKFEDIIKKYY